MLVVLVVLAAVHLLRQEKLPALLVPAEAVEPEEETARQPPHYQFHLQPWRGAPVGVVAEPVFAMGVLAVLFSQIKCGVQ